MRFKLKYSAPIGSDTKKRIFIEKYGLPAFTGKKIKYVAFLDRFLDSFEITHDLHFFKRFSCILK